MITVLVVLLLALFYVTFIATRLVRVIHAISRDGQVHTHLMIETMAREHKVVLDSSQRLHAIEQTMSQETVKNLSLENQALKNQVGNLNDQLEGLQSVLDHLDGTDIDDDDDDTDKGRMVLVPARSQKAMTLDERVDKANVTLILHDQITQALVVLRDDADKIPTAVYVKLVEALKPREN